MAQLMLMSLTRTCLWCVHCRVQGYMPGQLYKLDSCYGNSQQLQGLLQKLKDTGIDPLADIVINHRCVHVTEDAGWVVA
jgi:hypothetical protein